jgi:hypothetical protein
VLGDPAADIGPRDDQHLLSTGEASRERGLVVEVDPADADAALRQRGEGPDGC